MKNINELEGSIIGYVSHKEILFYENFQKTINPDEMYNNIGDYQYLEENGIIRNATILLKILKIDVPENYIELCNKVWWKYTEIYKKVKIYKNLFKKL